MKHYDYTRWDDSKDYNTARRNARYKELKKAGKSRNKHRHILQNLRGQRSNG